MEVPFSCASPPLTWGIKGTKSVPTIILFRCSGTVGEGIQYSSSCRERPQDVKFKHRILQIVHSRPFGSRDCPF